MFSQRETRKATIVILDRSVVYFLITAALPRCGVGTTSYNNGANGPWYPTSFPTYMKTIITRSIQMLFENGVMIRAIAAITRPIMMNGLRRPHDVQMRSLFQDT